MVIQANAHDLGEATLLRGAVDAKGWPGNRPWGQ